MKTFFLCLIVLLALDFIWLNSMSGFYKRQFGRLKRSHINWFAAALTYVLMALALSVFVIPHVNGFSNIHVFFYSAFLGVLVYGVYDFTNLSTIKGWTIKLSLVDTMWGGVLIGLTVLIVNTILKQ